MKTKEELVNNLINVMFSNKRDLKRNLNNMAWVLQNKKGSTIKDAFNFIAIPHVALISEEPLYLEQEEELSGLAFEQNKEMINNLYHSYTSRQ
jgi:hypothetical protein